ncbi:helix-turn-helix domain-containing protein [Pedobacter sp. G11]|uniref:helix-turn-helix domain-containing protein n=1 Tax=Pedobacter sp. G11 TaxID=2482728 RepID=UPI00143D0B15|nr:helix-turn-helix transcriptional regulator [Pedobacter sp. G11]
MRPTKKINKVNEADQKQLNRFLYFINKYVGKNQTAVAEALGMTQAYYSLIASGKRRISIAILTKLKEKHKLNIHWLQTGLGNEVFQTDPDNKPQSTVGKIIDLQAEILSAHTKIDILEVNLNQAYKLIQQLEARLEKSGL